MSSVIYTDELGVSDCDNFRRALLRQDNEEERKGSLRTIEWMTREEREEGEMAPRKFRVKDMIVVSLCTSLIVVPYLLMAHTPTAALLQKALADHLTHILGKGQEIDANAVRYAGNNHTSIAEEFPGLREVLEEASLPDKTVLLTTLNSAWARENSMIDLFLGSFGAGEGILHYLDHLVIIALDQASYDRCLQIHHHCFRLETKGIDFAAEKFFMSDDYIKMMWRRVEFLGIVLELGYSFLFSDADIMWFRDPFAHFSKDADFHIACDYFNGNPTDLHNLPNGGFVYVRSRERTIHLYKYWYAARLNFTQKHDQDVFNAIKFTKQFEGYRLNIEFLDTKYFGGFCQVSQDFEQVCTMHANCCTGLNRKLFDLNLTMSDWNQYKALTPQQRQQQRVFWQAPKECLHSWGN